MREALEIFKMLQGQSGTNLFPSLFHMGHNKGLYMHLLVAVVCKGLGKGSWQIYHKGHLHMDQQTGLGHDPTACEQRGPSQHLRMDACL